MPAIRLIVDQGKKTEREIWLEIKDYEVDEDGYLRFFRLHWDDQNASDLHLFRHNYKMLNLAIAIWGSMTSLRSARGLVQEWNKTAGKEGWHTKAGWVGNGFGSAALLAEFLTTRPFSKEGYYDANHKLILARKIDTRNRSDYDPRQHQ